MDIRTKLSLKQTKAWDTLESSQVKELLYGGAKGGGKSVFGCFWLYAQAKKIIDLCDIEEQTYPIPIAFMGRKRGVDFNDTTLETWKRFIPSGVYELKKQEKEIIIENRVKIVFGGFDDEDQVKKFNSAEYAIYFIDQAEEVSRDDIGLLRGTLRLKINGIEPSYKGLLTANPAPCWLKDEFILNPPKNGGKVFIQALPKDNPFLPVNYIETLQDAFKHRPELIKAYIEGSWDELEGGNFVIQHSWIRKAVNGLIKGNREGKRIVVCDPARFGDDETVIYAMQDEQIIDNEIYGQKSTMETAGRLVIMRKKHNANLIIVDVSGLGAGIVDRLRELREPVYELNTASKAIREDRFVNIRAEMWWEAGQKFYNDRCNIVNDRLLISQLASTKYEVVSNGKIKIEPKEEIKKRLSSSPDRADAYVMGLYALRYATTVNRYDDWGLPVDVQDRMDEAIEANKRAEDEVYGYVQ